MFLIHLKNELWKLFARKRSFLGFGAFLAVEGLILLLMQLPKPTREVSRLLGKNGYAFEEYYSGLTLGLLMLLFTVFLIGGLFLALVSGDMVAKEAEEGTLRMALARPVTRLRLVLVKWIACVIYGIVLIVFIAATSLLAGVLYRRGLGNLFVFSPIEQIFSVFETREGLIRFVRAIALLAFSLQAISTLGFAFSCFNMKPAAATILTLTVFFVDFVLRTIPYFQGIERYFLTWHTACWIRTFHTLVPWWDIAESLAYLGAFNLSLFLVGAAAFCSRDLKS
ncbi:MAG: ABC transporter permease [Verrucomicrobiae bacterium]|nr:ABC transporter permease [Verrucomicrobiae bacterium]